MVCEFVSDEMHELMIICSQGDEITEGLSFSLMQGEEEEGEEDSL